MMFKTTPAEPRVSNTRIVITDPRLIAAMAEAKEVGRMADRLAPYREAIDDASPDAAIAVWIRFRQAMTEVSKRVPAELREVVMAAKAAGHRIDDLDMDASIPTLPTHTPLLYKIAHFQAVAQMAIAYVTAQETERSPSRVMVETITQIETFRDVLIARINDLVREAMGKHAATTGKALQPGRVSFHLTTSVADPSAIIVAHHE